ncbi:MAG: extracellular solute-binding protein [Pseudomonadota bacterium]
MSKMVRACCVFALVALGNVQAESMRVATWGGVYGDVYQTQVLQSFVRSEQAGSSSVGPVSVSQPGSRPPDAVELSLHEAMQGCASGELMLLPPTSIDAMQKVSSYLPNAVQPCSIGQWAWATVAGFSRDIFPDHAPQPALAADFFNTTDFPGKRALRRTPRVIVEWALAASGVPANRTYDALQQIDDVWPLIARQLRQLEGQVLWVDSDAEALEHLRNGTVTLAMVSSNSVLNEAIASGRHPGVVWDAAVIELSMLAIPVKAPDPERSTKLLRYVSDSKNTLEFAAALGFSPVGFEAVDLLNSEYRQYLAAASGNYRNGIWGDSVWWRSAAGAQMTSRFAEWTERLQSLDSLVMADPDAIVSAAGDVLSRVPARGDLFTDANF